MFKLVMRFSLIVRVFAVCLSLLHSSLLIAELAPDIRELQRIAEVEEFQKDPVWRQLMHYESSSRAPAGIESQVDDIRFFLSENGKTDPLAELLASIDRLLNTSDSVVNDDHPRCRFISREKWLRKKLDLAKIEPPKACKLYADWRAAVGSYSMSLVFPASYLNSPSSMFGHTLLRLDPENIDDSSKWLSWSLNFAAETGSENFSAGYAFKGIAGGYAGKFSSVPYFKKLQEYGAIENRDIWEYQLDFTPDELSRMLDHAWELRDIQFDYYFFRQNCSYRLLELMDYARPGLKLTQQFRVTTIPADTVKAVVKAGIVDKTYYRPSLGTEVNTRYQALPNTAKHWVNQIANNPNVVYEPEFDHIDQLTKAQVIRVANDLLTYRSRRTTRSPEVAKRRLALLNLISQLPVEKSEIQKPDAPEGAHDTRMFSIARGRTERADFTELGLRWSYHDVLDNSSGYLRGAGIELGSFSLRHFDSGDVKLQSLTLVNLQSISDRALVFNSLSWNLSVAIDRNPKRLNNRLFGRLGGSIGKSTEIIENNIGYALLGASVSQYSEIERNFADARIRMGVLNYHGNAILQMELRLESPQASSLETITELNYNIPWSRNHALRFSYSCSFIGGQCDSSASVQYRYYF